MKVKYFVGATVLMFPIVTLAAEPQTGGLLKLLGDIGTMFGKIVPIVTTLALIYFIYGLAEYVLESGNEAKKAEGKNRMTWGIIAMFCIVSIWGIVRFIRMTVGVDDNVQVNSPSIPQPK